MTPITPPEIVDLGRAPFDGTRRKMVDLTDEIHRGESPGRILLVEHDPVYTAGRGTPVDEITPETRVIERGGGITYHGPGQLVIYPVVPLPRRDVRHWLRSLEQLGIAVCARFGLDAEASLDGTGVFVGRSKIASIGVAIRHWINLHGISINVNMDLSPWQRVRPCGLDPSVMTDLSRAAGRSITMDEARHVAREEVFLLLEPDKSCK